MQLLEHTPFGVRSAVMALESRRSTVRFVLVPMVHLGTPEFYGAVHDLLAGCDIVVAEGVPGRRAWIITLAYRLGGRFRRGDLVLQKDALDLSSLDAEIVRPDLDARELASGWRRMRWHLRFLIYLAAPLLGLWMAIDGPRRALTGQRLTVDDEISLEEYEHMRGGVQEALVDARDERLCQELVRLAADGDGTVGVCWGAAHMRAVTATLLAELGYRIVDSYWLTVFAD